MSCKKGFTLLEIGVGVFILLLSSAAGLTGALQLRAKNVLKIQQNLIVGDLLAAKQRALAARRDADIIFAGQGYTVQAGTIREVILPRPFTVSALRLGYNPAGHPRYAGTLYLYRAGRPVARLTVAVGSGLLKWTNL
ncbi:MAG: hypothetical protein LBD99_02015 [Candidatus Margulisbacteria bacterium]|jgi:type II secretory pathway pseudopilin PulG|nr:hypothetical protein [Candidatus Margulisiibacteriota bacterium]